MKILILSPVQKIIHYSGFYVIRRYGIWTFTLLFYLIFYNSFAQTDSTAIYDLNLSQLSKLNITSASKITQNIEEVPTTVFVISGTEIKENGYFTLEEALSALPGFQFRNTLGLNSYIFQRGMPNQNNLTLVLIDGVQVNELNSGGFYAGGQYNMANIDRIEVIYGPSSVAYGTNAITGIINIITKNPGENKSELNALIGSYNTSESDFTYSYFNKNKDFGILASGMLKKSDKANLRAELGDNNWSDLMDNFENDYTLDLKIKFKDFTIGTNYLYKESSTATSIKSIGTIFKDFGTSWNIRFINNYLKYQKNLSENLVLSSTLYNRNATVLDNTVYYVVDTAQIGYYRPNNLSGLENVLNFKMNDLFSVTGGLTFEFESLAEKNSSSVSDSPEQKPPKPEKPTMVNNYLASVFIEPRVTLFKSLFLSGGVRFDKSSIYDQVLTPRVGLIYHFSKSIYRLSYAEAFRAPKPWDYSDGIGNSSLLPEKMKSMEAAITVSIFDHLSINFIGYSNKLENSIKKEILNDSYRWINRGEIVVNGFDVFARYNAKNIKTTISYTFNKSKDEFGEIIPEISIHSANSSITYSLNQFIKLNLRANFYGKRDNPKLIASTISNIIDPFVVFNGALSMVNYKGFNMQLLVKNLFNKEYYHSSNRDPDRYRQPQRTLMLSFGYLFNN